jgi:hypothetical protein
VAALSLSDLSDRSWQQDQTDPTDRTDRTDHSPSHLAAKRKTPGQPGASCPFYLVLSAYRRLSIVGFVRGPMCRLAKERSAAERVGPARCGLIVPDLLRERRAV